MSSRLAVSLALATSLATACSSPTDETPTLAADVQPILDRNCAVPGCHAGSSPEADLSLEPSRAHAALVGASSTMVPGATRVVAGDPAASLFLQVLRGPIEDDPPVFGMPLVERMPRDTSPLDDDEIALIEAWIEAGAPE